MFSRRSCLLVGLVPAVSVLSGNGPSSFGNVFIRSCELDKYNLLRVIGSGGFGRVWLAQPLVLVPGGRQSVAIKVIRRNGRKSARNFQTEVSILHRLSSSGYTPALLESFFDSRFSYIVQEFVSEVSLYDLMKRPGSLTEDVAVDIFSSLVSCPTHAVDLST